MDWTFFLLLSNQKIMASSINQAGTDHDIYVSISLHGGRTKQAGMKINLRDVHLCFSMLNFYFFESINNDDTLSLNSDLCRCSFPALNPYSYR